MTDEPQRKDGATELRGSPVAAGIRTELAARVARLVENGTTPHLAVVVGSDDPAVAKYAGAKGRMAEKLGIGLSVTTIEPTRGQQALNQAIDALCADRNVHGVILELPLGPGLDAEEAIARITPAKDVDGLTTTNLGLVAAGWEANAIAPATPAACIRLAELVGPLAGKRAAVVGRGRSVGRALAPMLVNRDVTVTICHTKTPDLAAALAPCDLIFVAAGRAGLIGANHVRPGQVVVDAGINVVDGVLCGDVDHAAVSPIVAALSPVPGGVGPLTSTLIFSNLMQAIALQQQS
ncbi:bifunctional 5,10-methylenetetrahydrofolate dehydrogenase/5,10-methenyltetrahydrofolate cyclohydrolase [Fodinicurvata sp. EGI_FJ10296]|uniref:bifunctional 5,10-methylenetetrahydrofolate dehydrogenase/5,10-methenyltetrahydrofolate cyclohydrolase n=1 Tax=Fodinicurvata sp. EGI_FJ10296 TaxID=3231908 RepID=UPI003455AE67